jgi:hypothetical protein
MILQHLGLPGVPKRSRWIHQLNGMKPGMYLKKDEGKDEKQRVGRDFGGMLHVL